MCGIAAILARSPGPTAALQVATLLNAIAHRGPDGTETRARSDGKAIGSVRLAMEDPKENFVLISNAEKSVVLDFNGEIYNWRELRDAANARGYRFVTDGDGEVIVALYETGGIASFDKIDGMFAFILCDESKNRTIIARDRHGIKPLYVYEDGRDIVVCSELNAIKKVRDLIINHESVYQYLRMRYVPAPATIYRKVSKLRPGEINVIDSCRNVITDCISSARRDRHLPIPDALTDAVLSMACSDSRIGVFLSGGLDSTAITAAAYHSGYVPPLFSIGYEGAGGEDETHHAKAIATRFGAKIHVVSLTKELVSEAIEKSIAAMDEPVYSTVSPSTWALSRYASEYVKGVLSGDGSDELLMGYGYVRYALSGSNSAEVETRYRLGIGWLEPKSIRRLFPWVDSSEIGSTSPLLEGPCTAQSIRAFEVGSRLPDYHLARVDRMSMAHGLEVRVPFLRDSVVGACLACSPDELAKTLIPKLPLVEWVRGLLHPHKWERHKQPFTAPVQSWIREGAVNGLQEVILDNSVINIVGADRPVLEKFLGCEDPVENWREVWGLYILSRWIDGHV